LDGGRTTRSQRIAPPRARAASQRVARCDAVVISAAEIDDEDPVALCRRLGIEPVPAVVVLVDVANGGNRVAVALGASRVLRDHRRVVDGVIADVVEVAPTASSHSATPARTEDGRISLDARRRVVHRDGMPLDLPRLEFDLLAYLMARPGQVVVRQELLERVWGFRSGATATITVHLGQLRRRIEPEPAHPRHLVTVRGVGYRFDP
jgi:DNA-binding response OmpR family regulator